MRTILAFLPCAAAVVALAVSCAPNSGLTNNGFGGDHGTGGQATGGSSGTTSIMFDAGTGGASCSGATTCAKAGVACGPIGDGCGGVLQCGTCSGTDTCGGGGTPGQCGHMTCVQKTCASQGANCGPVGDGCGGMLQCGTCSGGDTCGGGGVGSVCGSGGTCVPLTCAQMAVNCGPVGDGCGNTIQCGSCPSGQSCGGGGIGSVCGSTPCVPQTCAQAGVGCGPTGDGCGNVIQCGSCGQPQTCGGAGVASQCGIPSSCTGLCLKQVTCSNPNVTTTLSGIVYAPNGVDPLPNALVYVPNAPVQAFAPGVSCDNCGAPASGSPLVSAVSAIDGTFTISNVPVVSSLPLVIQLGRWRRQVVIPTVTACTDNPVSAGLTHLPQTQGQGDIPLMAFSTGAVDALECVMRKIGVADTEFTTPTGGGRIHLYEGLTDPVSTAAGGAVCTGSPSETSLWGSLSTLKNYDMVLFPCQADQATTRTAAEQQNVIDYANAGGRIFATHFSYVWLYNDAPFKDTAAWHVEQHPSPADQDGYVDTSFPKGQALAEWLQIVNASTFFGVIPLSVIRHDNDGPRGQSQSWITIDDMNFPGANVHYTFNTPIGVPAAQQCGRVLYDDFHVENVGDSKGVVFPKECVAGTMTAQEKLLEFMIFDLGSCITPDQPPPCQTVTCAALGVHCGPAADGCGGLQQCGSCSGGQTCGGGGQPGVCGSTPCTPRTCQAQGIQCGPAGDGCGNAIVCGACATGQTCGGGGQAGVCGNMPCTPTTCTAQGIHCGPAGDGCGGVLQCGSCSGGQTCGGGGTPGACGTYTCKPKSCADLGANCGPVGDGCGGQLQCGTCSPPQTCGGGGTASVCGGSGPG